VELGRGVGEAHDQLGRILIQVGAVAQGIHRLRNAIRLEPELAPLCLAEIARAFALTGEHHDVDEALATAERNATVAQLRMLTYIRARIDLWRGDRAAARRFASHLLGDTDHQTIQRAFGEAADGTLSTEIVDALRTRFGDA